MNHEELKQSIGANIIHYRKAMGITQAELAQRLNYSDKAVSKWERGESIPDILTLADIAEQFHITLNELVYGPQSPAREVETEPLAEPESQAVPENTAAPRKPGKQEKITDRIRHNRKVIQGLVSILVWIVVLAFYVLLDSFQLPYLWLLFLIGIPAHAITLLSLRSAWQMYSWNQVLISIIMWGCLLCLHVIIYLISHINIWRLFLMGALGQMAIILWFHLIKKPKED